MPSDLNMPLPHALMQLRAAKGQSMKCTTKASSGLSCTCATSVRHLKVPHRHWVSFVESDDFTDADIPVMTSLQ